VGIKGNPKQAILSHQIAVSSSGETYIKESGNSHKKTDKITKKKRTLSRETFSRIRVIIPTASIIQLVRRTARAKIVKL